MQALELKTRPSVKYDPCLRVGGLNPQSASQARGCDPKRPRVPEWSKESARSGTGEEAWAAA